MAPDMRAGKQDNGGGCAEFAQVIGIIKSAQTGTTSPPSASSVRPCCLRQRRSRPSRPVCIRSRYPSIFPRATGFTPCPYGTGRAPAPSKRARNRHATFPLNHHMAFVSPLAVLVEDHDSSSSGFELLIMTTLPLPNGAGAFREIECSRARRRPTGRHGTP